MPWNLGGIIGSGASFTGLGAASWGPNRIDVFAVIAPNVVHRWYDLNNVPQGWSTVAGQPDQPFWEPLGTPPAGGPPQDTERPNWPPGSPAATTMGANRLDVFVHARDDDFFVWHKYFQGDRWSNWGSRHPGTYLAGDPTAASWGPGRTDIIWPQSSSVLPPRPVGFLLHDRIINYEWNRWAIWNQNLFPPFALSSWGPERLDLFGFRDGNILHIYCQGAAECI
jgi:hypothetical protein